MDSSGVESGKLAGETAYRDLVERMPGAAVVLDADHKILYCNGGLARMLGCEALAGTDWLGLVALHQNELAQKVLTAGQKARSYAELTLSCAGGPNVKAQVSAAPICFEGRPCVALVVTDLGEIDSLRESEQLFKLFVEHAPVGIVMLDRNLRYVAVSRRWLKNYNINEDVIGRSHYDLFPETPDDWKDMHRRCLAGAVERQDCVAFQRADGRVQWIKFEARPWPKAHGQIGGILIYTEDVTDRRKAEQAALKSEDRYRLLVEQAVDGIFLSDAAGRYVDVNSAGCKMLGYTREEILSRTIGDVLAREELGRLSLEVTQLDEGQTTRSEWRFLRKDGSEIVGEVVGRRLPDGHLLGILRDMTERKQTEREIIAAKAEAESANRAKSRFLAAASHDLRQPAQSLVLLLAVIERQLAGQNKTVQTAKIMRAAVTGLHELLTSVLDISQLDAGVVTPAAEDVDLGALVRRLATEYAVKAADRGLALRLVARALHTRTDPALLERALRNLIENALRYTAKGGILLGVRRRGASVRIDVIDTGIGIPADKQAEIFQEFHQLNNPSRNLEQGLGLGLAIVVRLAHLLGARVEMASRVARGSRFSLSLPMTHAAAPKVAEKPEVQNPGGRVLIIEDNAIVCIGLEAMLGEWGYETFAATSGEEALELAARENARFDLILADHQLGAGANGVETAREIARRAGRAFPTLVLTGDTSRERSAEIAANGFSALFKPVSAEDLRRELARLLEA